MHDLGEQIENKMVRDDILYKKIHARKKKSVHVYGRVLY
ncbi:hypothetical protein H175_ch5559 [Bacillus thuringiensis serovar thuringiensis str. IS5056]|nr:hypothetical protein H175_ch5559 [Bacillus thuringiensis serovar thuringiensis str. IS5056]